MGCNFGHVPRRVNQHMLNRGLAKPNAALDPLAPTGRGGYRQPLGGRYSR
jgi:hypothetical protein